MILWTKKRNLKKNRSELKKRVDLKLILVASQKKFLLIAIFLKQKQERKENTNKKENET